MRREKERITLRFLVGAIERMEFPFSEMGRAAGKAPLGEEKEFVLAISMLRFLLDI